MTEKDARLLTLEERLSCFHSACSGGTVSLAGWQSEASGCEYLQLWLTSHHWTSPPLHNHITSSYCNYLFGLVAQVLLLA